MEQISITPFVRNMLDDLVQTLYDEEYFAYLENSEEYVKSIYQFLYSIPDLKHYRTGTKKYGEWYCRYKPNKHTTWYATFSKENNYYIIRNVINNHTKEYPDFIKSIGEK